MSGQISENLKITLEKAERYTLLALTSAVAFAVLSLPARTGTPSEVKWSLLGFELDFDPRLALLMMYGLYAFSCLFADNMLLHVQDLATRNEPTEVREMLMYPTILTVSPIGQLAVTVIPGILICFGLWRSYVGGVFNMPWIAWWFAFGYGGVAGLEVYARVRLCIDKTLRDLPAVRSDKTPTGAGAPTFRVA